MATVTAWWQFQNGEQGAASVEVENDYPDALNQSVSTCIDLFIRAMCARQSMSDDE